MTVPPLRKWRPCFGFYRDRIAGWQFFIHPHPDHNPIVTVMRWDGYWRIEIRRWIWSNEPRHVAARKEHKRLMKSDPAYRKRYEDFEKVMREIT